MCDKYPSIEQFRHFIKELTYIRTNPTTTATAAPPTHYHLTGTVKLHGTHADLVATRTSNTADWQYNYQSRNRILTVQSDNMGYAAYMDGIPVHERSELIDSVARTYMAVSGRMEAVTNVLLAGEWCGRGIQSGVALDKLPRMYVVYGVRVNGVWQPITTYRHVSLDQHRLYNILRVPAYTVTVDYDTITDVLPQLMVLTREVERECPFGQSFGVSGVGEGIVWVCDELINDSRGWFKTKGDKHAVTHIPPLLSATSSEATRSKLANCTVFASEAVTEGRLEQGLAYLKEMQLPVTRASTGEYVRWVWQDVQKEEGDSISELGLDKTALGKAISKRALQWYQATLKLTSAAADNTATDTAGTVDDRIV